MAVAKWLVNLVNRTLESKATAPQPEPPASSAPASSEKGQAQAGPVGSGQVGTVDQLLAKFSCLIEQSCDRTQSVALLENRLEGIEAALRANQDWAQCVQSLSQAVIRLDSRLSAVEQALEQTDLAAIATALASTTESELQLKQWANTANAQMTELGTRLTAVENTVETTLETVGTQGNSTLDKMSETLQHATVLEDRIVSIEKMVARLSIVPKFVESNHRSIVFLQDHVRKLTKSPVANGHRNQN
ncbi:MAG: hypothetical protein ICV62_02305 [Cyanobacteria bacterium Co-bin13]|nr:hypothetical protein [Cyanobacteria bacterium Co-bin13]